VCYLLTLQVNGLKVSTRNRSVGLIVSLNFFECLFKAGKSRLQVLHMLKQQFVGDVFGHGWSSRVKGFSGHICVLLAALSTFATPSAMIAETAKPEDMLRFIHHFEARGSYDLDLSRFCAAPDAHLCARTTKSVRWLALRGRVQKER
jgi:hypothetical protein